MSIIATYSSAADLKKAIRKKANEAIQEVSSKGLLAAKARTRGFYTGSPLIYQRTGKLGESPETTGVSGKGSIISTEIYLNQNYDYNTGTWSTPQIFKAAESGNSNLVGSPHFWEYALNDIYFIVREAFRNNGFE